MKRHAHDKAIQRDLTALILFFTILELKNLEIRMRVVEQHFEIT